MSPTDITIFIAFLAGVLSFLSPCVLPLVPAYLGHLLGVTAAAAATASPVGPAGLEKDDTVYAVSARGGTAYRPVRHTLRLVAASHAAMFVLGFSLVFVTFWASLGVIGQLLPGYIRYVRPLGGIILIILGLNMAGLLRIAWLYRSFGLRPTNQKKELEAAGLEHRPGLPASFFTGVVFAAGWTPCIGPVLGGIIGLASESITAWQGIYLLVAYSLGLGVPFMLCALLLGQANGLLRSLNRSLNGLRLVSIVSGLFVVAVGVLMLTNVFQTLPRYFNWLPL